jgi:hypothetical protein
MYTEEDRMATRAGKIAAIILVFAGLMFVADVLSPATPTPQAVQDAASLVFGIALLLAAVAVPLLDLISPSLRSFSTAIALCADRVIGPRTCVLLC